MKVFRFYDYFIMLVREQMEGVSIGVFITMSILSVAVVYLLANIYERFSGKCIKASKKKILMLMAVYACFILQIAFFRRIGTIKTGVNLRLYLGFRKWDGSVDEKQLVYSFLNVVFFIPWGVLLSAIMDNNVRRFVMTFFYSLLTSLSIEVLQFLTKTGRSEVTDLVTNVTGGMIGCIIYIAISFVIHRNNKFKEG